MGSAWYIPYFTTNSLQRSCNAFHLYAAVSCVLQRPLPKSPLVLLNGDTTPVSDNSCSGHQQVVNCVVGHTRPCSKKIQKCAGAPTFFVTKPNVHVTSSQIIDFLRKDRYTNGTDAFFGHTATHRSLSMQWWQPLK
jgi:hypothetical protein